MSIQSEISRITDMRDQSFTELASKGVNVPSGVTIDDLPEYIAALPETIKGHGVPTTSTEGLVGQHYFNLSATEPPYEYVCSDISGGAYTWIPAGYGSIPIVGTITLTAANWTGSGPFTQTVMVTGATITANSKVDIQPDATVIQQMLTVGMSALFIANNAGVLTAYAIGATFSGDVTVQATVTEVL